MKRRIKRLSPHQNGKVAAIVMAITSLPMVLLMFIPMSIMWMGSDHPGNFSPPFIMLIIMPIFYLIFTYIGVTFACWVYNLLVGLLGGFEFEFDQNPNNDFKE